jgi:cytochrome c biogenesis protein CcmG/thiol:disulfide interchange protein DsbE
MTSRQQWVVVATVVAAVATGVLAGAHLLRDQLSPVTVGSRAPDFHAVTLDSIPRPRSLADYKGEVTMVNVWATWCAPCEQEMPVLQRMYERHSEAGFRLVAVSIDSPGMEQEIRRFVQRFGLTFDVAYDAEGRIMRDYMTVGVPETFLIGRDGVIRRKNIGPFTDRDSTAMDALITKLLAER